MKHHRKESIAWLADSLLAIPAIIAAQVLAIVRRYGIRHLPLTRSALLKIGVFPLQDHYYEPLFNPAHLRSSLRSPRNLPAIDWQLTRQVQLLRRFNFRDELLAFPSAKPSEIEFGYDNGSFCSGDAECYYSLVRHFRPRRILEVGSGNSTLIAIAAAKRNAAEASDFTCEISCVEPYEAAWLERTGARVIRKRVEDLPMDTFTTLEANDILFIDSSHMIRPQGDVLFEILEVLPRLRPGVLVHIHDIFSPRDYLDEWIHEDMRFWNEQYLLEAFLSCNSQWEVVLAVNMLKHEAYDELHRVCPMLTESREPGSFWLRRVA